MSQTRVIHGLTVTIENPKGSVRSGMGPNGSWQTTMCHDYGDIVSPTLGADGDPVDVFLGDNPDSELVVIVNQINPSGAFDEHKVLLGFDSEPEAVSAYLANYDIGWQGMGSSAVMDVPTFMHWLQAGDLSVPAETETTETTDADDLVIESDDFGLSDACLLTEAQYEIVDSERPGKVKLNLLASLAGVVNENNRYFTPEFYRAMLPRANAYVDAMERYGEEPHPPFDPERRQFVTSLQNKIWDQGRWYVDGENLFATVYLDPAKPREAAVIERAQSKSRVGCSVRWHAGREPKSGRTKAGRPVQLFDAEVGEKVFAAVLDYVPNPAFTQAGRVMTDSTLLFPMTDAAAMTQEPLAPETPPETASIQFEPTHSLLTNPTLLKEKHPVTIAELRAQAATLDDSPAKAALLDAAAQIELASAAAQGPTVSEQVDAALAKLMPDIQKASSFVDAQEQRRITEAEAAKVAVLADSVLSGTAPEVSRFTDESVRAKFAGRIRAKATEAEARVALTDAIEHQDEINNSVSLAMKGYRPAVDAGGDPAGAGTGSGQAQGKPTGASSDRVEVMVEGKEKEADHFIDSINDSTERNLRTFLGYDPDPLLHKALKDKVDKIVGPVERRLGRAAVVDSVAFLTSPTGKKDLNAGLAVLRGMTDAGMLDVGPITDAVMTTTNILQQPVFLPLVLRPMYQNMQCLKYMGVFGPDAQARVNIGGDQGAGFDGGSAGGNLGRVFRYQSRYFEPPVQSTMGLTRGSGRITENAGIPRSQIMNKFQSFNTYRRALAFGMTKEVINWTATGAAPFDLLGENIAQNIALYARESDNLGYFEMVSVTLEQNCVSLVAPETVAPGNLTNGPTQDGVTYNRGSAASVLFASPDNPFPPQNVVAIAQPDCGAPAQKTPAAAGRLADPGFTPSASNACRTPLVPPREFVSLDNFNNETTTVNFPIVAMKGATVLVPGYVTADGRIGSAYDPVAGTVTQAQYAVDFVRGKVLFAASAGVTAATTTLTLLYSYATNFNQIQVKFGSAGYPNGQLARAYADNIFIGNNQIAADMGSHPNYSTPDYCLSSKRAAAYVVQSDIFDKLRSPTGTNLINPTADTYAEYNSVMYDQFNAPSILGDDAMLLIKNGMSKYTVETPLHTEGGFTGYDASNQLVARTEYMMNQFETFCTPLAQDRNGLVFNQPSRLVILF